MMLSTFRMGFLCSYGAILEACSQSSLEMCLHDGSSSGQVDSEDYPSRRRIGVESSEHLGKEGAQKKGEDLLEIQKGKDFKVDCILSEKLREEKEKEG